MNVGHVSDLDLNLLRVFHAVYAERSVSRAAERLQLSQSGVSHALAKLRRAFGDELLVRVGNGMAPTPRADQLYLSVQSMVALLEAEVLPLVDFDPRQATRRFVTAMSDMAEVVVLPALLPALRERAPGCTVRNVRLRPDDIDAALASGEIDLAIGNGFEPQTNLYQQGMYEHGYGVLVDRDHPRIRDTLSLPQYLHESHVVADAGSDHHLVVNGLAPRGLQRTVAAEVGGLMSVPWLLPGTPFIATVPMHLARLASRRLPLRLLPLPLDVPPFAIRTLWHARTHTDVAHRWFRQTMFEVIHDYPRWADKSVERATAESQS